MRKKKVVVASGVFDIVHIGHIKYLKKAKQIAGKNGVLLVVLARDKLVEKIKGKKPLVNEKERKVIIESLKFVDKAILGPSKTDVSEGIRSVIQKYKPSAIVLGYDQEWLKETTQKIISSETAWKSIKVIKLRKYGSRNSKSSIIKRSYIHNYLQD
ncbi:MAG: adenylyltransferase/cytidyltransferase family protein [Thermoproteota archaeon]|nr:adenylyltransferase/cytidyltransferase family protein [Candidatus Brockarchaeota archaeon]MBO3800830.1 adenylyltransferase/cytidyltransferase family protein [Candidatus Brockarchaeota archaeon]